MQYDVSVIIAVYNCEQYIEEAVRSVEAQTIGKEHIQLILVNDGSTDKSGEICDRISAANANSIVIHKEHCGVSAARNTGLEIADGRFLTFIDADDLWIGSAFLEAVAFLDRHPETDVVAFPMYWFDARSGQHDKNDKFANGTRVIDLEEEPNYSLFSVSSSFFRRSVFADIRFDTRLMFAEDMLVCQKVLSKKKTLGVFSGESKYMYRRRKNGSSAMQHTRDNPYWYIPKAQILKEELLSSQQDIPTFIQYAIMNDFEWYLNISDESKVLSPQDVSVFRNTVISVLEILSDEVILSSTLLMNIQKYCALCIKYRRYKSDGILPLQNDLVFKSGMDLSFLQNRVDFITVNKKDLEITGVFTSICSPPFDDLVLCINNDHAFPCIVTDIEKVDTMLGITYCWHYKYYCQIPLSLIAQTDSSLSFHHNSDYDTGNKALSNIRYGRYAPAGTELNVFEPLSEDYLICGCHDKILIQRSTWLSKTTSKLQFVSAVFKSQQAGAKKALLLRIALTFLRPFFICRHIWLINDRIDSARDNGEAFFQWLCNEKKHSIIPVFVISKSSVDFKHLQTYGQVIPYNSHIHKLFYLLSDAVFSSAGELDFLMPFQERYVFYRKYVSAKKTVYLQHGVTKSDLSTWLGKTQRNFYGFITSSQKERDFVIDNYGYTKDQVWLTGMARYDLIEPLLSAVGRPHQITVMPTWRKYLMGELNHEDGTRDVLAGFEESQYVISFHRLLSDEKLRQAAKAYGYTLAFRPHPNLMAHISKFNFNDDIFIDLRPVAEVFANSALLINDYSSGSYDFSYLYRPVVFYQFDREQFLSGAHTFSKENIDSEEDLLGELVYEHDTLVDLLIDYMKTGCQLKEKFRPRIDKFFQYHDFHNCQRIYDCFLKLDSTDYQN